MQVVRADRADAGARASFAAEACGVCGDMFTGMERGTAISQLTCGHCFCAQCIEQWFKTATKNSCPTCRRVYSGLRSAKRTTAAALMTDAEPRASPPLKKHKQRREKAHKPQKVMPKAVAEKHDEWLKKSAAARGRPSALSTRAKGTSAMKFLQRECGARGLTPSGSKSDLAEQLSRFELGMAPVENDEVEVALKLNELVMQLEEDAMDDSSQQYEDPLTQHLTHVKKELTAPVEHPEVDVAVAMEAVTRQLEDDYAAAKLPLHRLALLAQRQQADDAVAWMWRERLAAKDRDELGKMQWLELQQFMLQQQKHRRQFVLAGYVVDGCDVACNRGAL